MIKLIKMGLLLGVVSDAPSREAWMRICQLNLHHLFDSVVTFNDTGFSKPAPEPFEKICDNLKVKPNEVIMIGDWPERDLDGAENVGMKTAFAKYGASSYNENQYKAADIVLNDISEIVDYIEAQNNK